MGKRQRTPRTKGNTRPSSSGHSAELLSTTGPALPSSFLGFQNYPKDALGLKSSSPKAAEGRAKSNDDTITKVIMKKMLKRDVVTKLKAVQEFIEFCSEDSDVKSILPYWPRLFNKLALDPDKRVRELIHKANGLLVLKVKKDVAPYLKSYMGTWLITQCDPYGPAASAARYAFSSAFPSAKQSEALMFCRSEILQMMQDDLLSLSPDAFSQPTGLTEEECQDKYQLLMTCVLCGMKLFISILGGEDKMTIVNDVIGIVHEERFWVHAQSKIPQIRGAWYNLISSLCREIPVVFIDLEDKLIVSTMGSLSESDPIVVSAVWECALQVTLSFKDWWCHIDVFSIVLPELWKFLKHGGMGNAVDVFPSLLPFLSGLPEEIIGTGVNFHKEFFSCIRESLSLSKLKVPSECNAVVQAFLECLQHSVERLFRNPEYDRSIIEHLVTEQLIPLVKISMEPEGSHVAASSFYRLLGQYLQSLEDKSFIERKSDKLAQYSHFLTLFWDDAYYEIVNILNMPHTEHCEELKTLAFFFHAMFKPLKDISEKKKKQLQLDFESTDSDSDWDSDEMGTTQSYAVPCKYTSAFCDYSVLFKYTVKTCGYICLRLELSLQPCCIKLLADMIAAVSSSELFPELLTILHVPVDEIICVPYAFFQTVVLKWAKRTLSDDLSLDCIVDVILSIRFCADKQSTLDLLGVCSKFESQKLYAKLVLKILESKKNAEIFNEWFQTPTFGANLRLMTHRLIRQLTIAEINRDGSQAFVYRAAILKCISEAASEEPRVPRKYIDTILSTCLTFLSDPRYISRSVGEFTFIDLVCEICENLIQFSMESLDFRSLDFLMFRLFILSIDQDRYNLSEERKNRMSAVWQGSIRLFVDESIQLNETSFLFMASDHLHNLLQVPLSSEMRNTVMTITMDFLTEVEDACCDIRVEPYGSVFLLMIAKIFPSLHEWEGLKKGLELCTVPSILKGKWFYPIVAEDCLPVSRMVLPQLISTAEIASNLLHRLLFAEGRGKADEELKKPLLQYFPHLLWSLCYVESVEYFKIQTDEENPLVSSFQQKYEDLAKLLNLSDLLELCNDLFNLSLCDGMTWGIPFEKLIHVPPHSCCEMMEYLPDLTQQIRNGGRPCANKLRKPSAYCDTIHISPSSRKFSIPKGPEINEIVNESITMQVCLRNSVNGLTTEFLESVPKDFFNIQTSASERDYFAVLAEVSCCVRKLQVQELTDNHEKILGFLRDLINYHRSFGSNENEGLVFVINFSAISSVVLKGIPDTLSCDLWCSIFEVIIVWFKKCTKIGSKVLKNTSALIFMHQTCTLICIICHLFAKKEAYHEVGEYYSLPVKAKWHQLFNDMISSELVQLYLQVAENVRNLNRSSDAVENLMIMLSQAIEYLNSEQIAATVLPFRYEEATYVEVTHKIYKVLHQLSPYLMSNSLSLQFGIHSILSRIVGYVPKLLDSRAKAKDQDQVESFKSFPLVEILQCTNRVVETVLADVNLGEYYTLKPYSSSYTYTVAYLLTWTELLEYFSATFSEELSFYTCCLEEKQLLSSLLMNLIRLAPENPPSCFGHIKSESTVKRYEYQCIFVEPPPISSLDEPCHRHVQHVACSLYLRTLKKVPALVRSWWNNLDRKTADFVHKFTSKHISGQLAMTEICAVHTGNTQFNNMTIKACPANREVLASYTLDDSAIELSIRLPANYPLGPIMVDSSRKLGVGQAQWRNWLLQLTSFLNYHNGSIIDALTLWKKNLDKKFEGVEECMICFFVLHSSSSKLPTLSCGTCKKKFHSFCLYKWFNTSNNSTCPGCRNYF